MRSIRTVVPPLVLSVWAAALCAPVQAQSLAELYASARGYDASYQAARAQYDATLARGLQAKAGILPTVGLQGGLSRTELDIATPLGDSARNYNTETVGVSATQPLYRPANWATYRQGQRQPDLAQAVLQAAEQDLIVRVAQAYFDVLGAQDSLGLVRAQRSAVSEQLAFARRNFEVGTATITDTREAQARYDLVVAQEIAAENDLQVKRLALDTLVGRPGSQPVPLAAPVDLPTVDAARMADWVAQAEADHPSVRQAQVALDIATLEVQKAQAGHKPTVDANLGYSYNNNPQGTSTLATPTRIKAATVGVTVTVPLFAGYAIENRVKETLALEEQSRSTLDNARRSVAQATRTAFLGLVSGSGQVRALEAAEASSQVALDANRVGYDVGVRINIDVLNAQSQLFQTKRDLALARYNLLVGNLRLRQANGTLAPGDIDRINLALATDGRPAIGNAGDLRTDGRPAGTTAPGGTGATVVPGNTAPGPIRAPLPAAPGPGAAPLRTLPAPAAPLR